MRVRDDIEFGRRIDEGLHAFTQNGLDQPVLDPGVVLPSGGPAFLAYEDQPS
jgi:hypothetical protein